jgi:hypothetical protein
MRYSLREIFIKKTLLYPEAVRIRPYSGDKVHLLLISVSLLTCLALVGIVSCSRHDQMDQPIADSTGNNPAPVHDRLNLPPKVIELELDTEKDVSRFEKDNIWDFLDGGAHEVLRLGFEQLTVAQYKSPNNERGIRAEVFSMTTESAARTLFDIWKSPKAKSTGLCGRGLSEDYWLCWQKGKTYVRIIADPDDKNAGVHLEAIGRALCQALSSD